jgi:hypothetical protein
MYRVDYATDDDTDIYLESFADTQHLDDGLLIPQNVQTTTNRRSTPASSWTPTPTACPTPTPWSTRAR